MNGNQPVWSYPFGMLMPSRTYQAPGVDGYRFGFNGQEQDNEVSGAGNSYTAQFWQYDSRLGRRWNVDPRPITEISPYACFRNNPLLFVDPNGDTTYVNSTGDVVWQQFKEDGSLLDELVYYTNDDFTSHTYVGELGGDINMDFFFDGKLAQSADDAFDPDFNKSDWINAVKKGGDWDLKNNKNTIWGVAWEYDHSEAASDNESKTSFSWSDMNFSNAADVGNFHAGYTGTYAGWGETAQKIGAGVIETAKNIKEGRWKTLFEIYAINQYISTFMDAPKDYKYNTAGMSRAQGEMKATGMKKTFTPIPLPKDIFIGPKY